MTFEKYSRGKNERTDWTLPMRSGALPNLRRTCHHPGVLVPRLSAHCGKRHRKRARTDVRAREFRSTERIRENGGQRQRNAAPILPQLRFASVRQFIRAAAIHGGTRRYFG